MKCYQHPRVDAVGVCTVCGRGVCEDCETSVAGRLYCKADLEAVLRQRRSSAAASKRPLLLSVASGLFVLYGIGELSLAVVLVYYGTIGNNAFRNVLSGLPLHYSMNLIVTNISLVPLIIASALLIASAIGLLSADRLWSAKRSGAVLGFVQVLMGTSLTALFVAYSSSVGVAIAAPILGLNAALACLIVAGRKSLK